jgi:uncharacterized damage-inducible protein DinB
MPIATEAQITAYETLADQLMQNIEGLSETQLRQKPEPGSWSIHEIIMHLADGDIVGSWRMRKALAEQEPRLDEFDQDAWDHNLSYLQQDRMLALQLLKALRASNAALLRSLPAEAWDRRGMHVTNGPMTVYDFFNAYLNHGKEHLDQIQFIKRSLTNA